MQATTNYLIIGNGYLGKKFHEYFKGSVMSTKRIQTEADVEAEIDTYHPKWILNCAGVTGKPNVDWCEDHKEETLNGNVLLPLTIAKVCMRGGIKMMHLGSGCVYQGDNGGLGFSEEDDPNFTGSFYSKTKAIAEDLLKSYGVLQLRLRMPVDNDLTNPRNFITKIITYKKVINEPNSITIVDDILKAANVLLEKNASGIYNITNPGVITHEEILKMYQEIVDPTFKYTLMSTDELMKITKAKRSNCVLNTQKLEKEIHITPVYQAVRKLLQEARDTQGANKGKQR